MSPAYDYQCNSCGKVFEIFHRMSDEPEIHCECGGDASKLMSLALTSRDKLWEFTDVNITGKPVQIRSKKQWKALLKEHNKHDDVSVASMEIINKNYRQNLKDKQRKNIHKALTSNWRDIKERGRLGR